MGKGSAILKKRTDTPEMIQTCLNCTKGFCDGACDELIAMKRRDERHRREILYEYRGQNLTLTEWAMVTGIRRINLESRLKTGHTIAEAIEWGSLVRGRIIDVHGERHNVQGWALALGVNYNTLVACKKRMGSYEAAIEHYRERGRRT